MEEILKRIEEAESASESSEDSPLVSESDEDGSDEVLKVLAVEQRILKVGIIFIVLFIFHSCRVYLRMISQPANPNQKKANS